MNKIKWETVQRINPTKPLIDGCYCHLCGFDWTDDAATGSVEHLEIVHNIVTFKVDDATFYAEIAA